MKNISRNYGYYYFTYWAYENVLERCLRVKAD